jgi:ABC-type multidrug transport system fused ATPase/permease subunit
MSFRASVRYLLFSDIKKIVRLAKKKVLQPEDMPALPKSLDPRFLPFAEASLSTESANSFVFSMLKASKRVVIPALLLNFGYVLFGLTKPVLVNAFIKRVSLPMNSGADLRYALTLAFLLGAVSFLGSICVQHYFMRMLGSFQIFTNAINRLIFKHSLRLTQKSRGETQVGDVVNHMSSDSDATSDIGMIIGDLQASLLAILGACVLLFCYLGSTAFISVGLLLLTIPLTRRAARSFSQLDEELMKFRDHRVTLMSQVLNGIRVVKFFAWEKSVLKEVGETRSKELSSRKKLARAEALSTLSYMTVSTLVLFASLGFHVYRGFELNPALVFTCISIFAILEDPFSHLSEVISRYSQAFVSAERIVKYLKREHLTHQIMGEAFSESDENTLPGIEIAGIKVQYDGQAKPALEAISLNILPGQSVAIVGPVGCGKSTFLQALLRELPLREGSLNFVDARKKTLLPRVAYVPQEAFIMNGTLKENLAFGGIYDGATLQTALRCSCLEADLPQLPAGLFTEIGERGVNLSGGQKQRVSLARAIMHQPTLALLDDPLSAVDGRTEEQLIERLLFGAWRGITRVVATHRLGYLSRFDKIVFLVEGKVHGVGTLDELALASPEFRAFFADSARAEQSSQIQGVAQEPATTQSVAPAAATASRVTEDEERAIGAVSGSVYLDYFSALGGRARWKKMITIPLLLATTAAASFLPLLQKSWLALSSNLQSGKQPVSESLIHALAIDHKNSILVYGGLGILTLLGVLINRLFWLERGMAAGRDLHNGMLRSVLKAPIRFFDSTPIGRVLQRFSRDVESVDTQLQASFEITVRSLMNIATSLLLILSVLPLMLVVIGPVLAAYYFLQRDYRIPAREAKRLDAISRSPRYAHFKETLHGLVVIRSFGKMDLFLEMFYERLEHSQKMFYGHYMLNRWFSSRIPLLGAIVSSGTAAGIVFYAYAGKISPGVAGLVIVYAIALWESLNWAVRVFAEVEARMTSVERLKFYGSLESEKDIFVTPAAAAATDWPQKGEVVFDRVVARYASHLPPILKGISFRVPAGSRVGIIGRTGSGKSTLLQALFRCMEAESGEIRIDGINIASVPLERVRRSLAIIPQDPTLFMGTLRNNLDRYSEFTDEEVWNSLRKARLEAFVKAQPLGLHAPVLESGANLSQGQRQLLCLSRALLADAKVIVMDEATASVDVQTDGLVQEVVRASCKNVTMLIIAHRLGTVADCDTIFELKEGKLHRTLDLKKESEKIPVC